MEVIVDDSVVVDDVVMVDEGDVVSEVVSDVVTVVV